MSTFVRLLEDHDESLVAAVIGASDSDQLLELAQVWATSTDPWAIEQLNVYVANALSCNSHGGFIRELLRSGEDAHNHRLMSALFVAFDRAIRRRRVSKTTEQPGSRRRRPAEVYSVRTLGWFRRRIWTYFRRLSEQNSAAYVDFTAHALRTYDDGDFATGESILDNRSLMKVCFGHSPLIAIGPVHVSLTAGSSVNDLTPAPWRPELWSAVGGQRQLIDLAVHGQAQFVRWWAATLCSRELLLSSDEIDESAVLEIGRREEPFLEPLYRALLTKNGGDLSADTWLELIASASRNMSGTLLEVFASVAEARQVSDGVVVEICRGITATYPPPFIAQVARALHHRRNTVELTDDLSTFIQIALQTPGCGRLRSWLAAVLLSLAGTTEQASTERVSFIARLLDTMSTSSKMDVIHELLVARNHSPWIESAMAQHCPEIRIEADPI